MAQKETLGSDFNLKIFLPAAKPHYSSLELNQMTSQKDKA